MHTQFLIWVRVSFKFIEKRNHIAKLIWQYFIAAFSTGIFYYHFVYKKTPSIQTENCGQITVFFLPLKFFIYKWEFSNRIKKTLFSERNLYFFCWHKCVNNHFYVFTNCWTEANSCFIKVIWKCETKQRNVQGFYQLNSNIIKSTKHFKNSNSPKKKFFSFNVKCEFFSFSIRRKRWNKTEKIKFVKVIYFYAS